MASEDSLSKRVKMAAVDSASFLLQVTFDVSILLNLRVYGTASDYGFV